MYETFEHTADLGLRIRSASLDTLFAEAAEAMFSAIVSDLSSIQPVLRRDFALPSDDRELLLFDWLKELLFVWDTEHLLFGKFEVQIGHQGLNSVAWGEPLDRTRHQLEHEVKAITYHGLRLEQDGDGWLAELIVDI